MGKVHVGAGMSGGIGRAQTEAAFVGRGRVAAAGGGKVAAMDMGNNVLTCSK